ncbi:MAG: hypothetical protein IJR77_08960 [Bacteroidales bacterium]|nr:hypothetical protein [Bacteroidales bacterium]
MKRFDTCFFEQYAQISLSALLGSEFDCLENMDRPDLQSPDGKSLGIEVTRAMEESKGAELALLKDDSRLSCYRITQQQRQSFYLEAVRRQRY